MFTVTGKNQLKFIQFNKFSYTADLLLDLDFKTQRVLTGMGWEDIPFNQNGLII